MPVPCLLRLITIMANVPALQILKINDLPPNHDNGPHSYIIPFDKYLHSNGFANHMSIS